jgi:DnaJ like chaperone protein
VATKYTIVKRAMAKNKKWFAGILGWTLGGPIGGMIGFALGTFLDSQSSSVN